MNTPLTPESLVNSFVAGDQTRPDVSELAGGGYVAVWQSALQDGSGSAVIVQRFTDQGERVGPERIVSETRTGNQDVPRVAGTDDGGFAVVWESPDGSGDGIFARRFGADGEPAGGEFRVNDSTFTTQSLPDVVALPGGGFAIAWEDFNGASGFQDDVRAKIYDASGVQQGAEFTVNTAGANDFSDQRQPALARIEPSAAPGGLASGGFLAVYRDASGADGDGFGILAQRYDVSGAALGAEFVVNATTASTQSRPAAAGLEGGRFVVAWEDHASADGSGFGIFARVFEGDGTPVGSDFQINVETSASQDHPEIVATTDGGFVALWTSQTSGPAGDGSGTAAVARRFDADGAALTGETILNDSTTGNQTFAAGAALPGGDFAALWTTGDASADGDGDAVMQRLFGDPSGFAAPSAAPAVDAVSSVREFAENVFESGAQRLDANGAAAVSDADSADFDGGRLIVSRISATTDNGEYPDQDAEAQHELSIDASARVSIAGTTVSVDGVAVGEIVSDGGAGDHLTLALGPGADSARLEGVVEHLAYRNLSDDPDPETTLSILLEDGDGAASAPRNVTIRITAEADAAAPLGGERQVTTVAADDQEDAAVAALADGGWIVVWTSRNQDNPGDNDSGVFAQRYDAGGVRVDGAFQVNATVGASQFEADVAGLDDGGWAIVWRDDNISGIRLNRYDAAGALVESELQVETESAATQFQPKIAARSDGGWVVTWTSQNSGAAGDGSSNGVIAQVFNASGARVGGEIVVNESADAAQDTAEAIGLGAGRFAVVWEQNDAADGDGDSVSIQARLFDAGGAAEGGEFQINQTAANAQQLPAAAALDGGGFAVAWRSQGQDGSSGGVYVRRFDETGAALGDEVRVNEHTSGDQTDPDIAALEGGGFVVSWTDTSAPAPGSGADVFAQAFDADGTRLDTQVRLNEEVASTQDESALAALPGGNYVAVWTSRTSGEAGDGSGDGVFQRVRRQRP